MCIKLDGRGDGQWTVQYSFVIEFQCFIKLNITLLWDLMHMWKVLKSIRDGISAKFITNDAVLCRPVRMGTSPPRCSSWRRWWRTMVSTSAARPPTSSSLTWPWRTGGGFRSIVSIPVSAVKRSIDSTTGCTITEKAPTRAFSWLKAPTSAFTFKTLLTPSYRELIFPI